MVVKASLFSMKISEVPTTLSPDGRSRKPHLRTWRDGWRHLRFLLMYSPKWLFLLPGLLLMICGTIISIIIFEGSVNINNTIIDIHTLLFASLSVIIGFQLILFYLLSKLIAIKKELLPYSRKISNIYRYITLERGILLGIILFIIGFSFSLYTFYLWYLLGIIDLDPSQTMRFVIPGATLMTLGTELILYSFFISIVWFE